MPEACKSKIALWFKNKNHCIAMPYVGADDTPIVENYDKIIYEDSSVDAISRQTTVIDEQI